MTNNKPIIIGSAEAREIGKRLERLEAQVGALLDGMNAIQQAMQGLCDTADGHEARLNALAIMKPVAVEHKGKIGG